jgi:predicted ATP-binding protein involved in virulence
MSDGFKSAFVFLFDLVVRAWEKGADINKLDNIPGIVMIDEIDLHLHPSWQRTILPVLTEEFPKIQFIVTTHSPYVAQSLHTNNIILLAAEKEEVTTQKLNLDGKPYGYEIDKIIEAVIGVEQEVPGISIKLMGMFKEFEKAVDDGDKQRVTHHYNEIKKIIPRNSDFSEYLKIMSAGLLVTNSK